MNRTGPRLRFVFLVLEDHPYGREMLRQLIAHGFVPDAVVEERSMIADQERTKFVERMRGFSLAPGIATLLRGLPTRHAQVDDHNGGICERILTDIAPELIVLGGTRILKPRIFARAEHGTLNAHPGLLPELRGAASVAWAIELDLPIGCTCHFIDDGVDTGPIVSRRELAVERGVTYEALCHSVTLLSGTLMMEAVRAATEGTIRALPQRPGGRVHRNMSAPQLDAVKRKLAEERYSHFVN